MLKTACSVETFYNHRKHAFSAEHEVWVWARSWAWAPSTFYNLGPDLTPVNIQHTGLYRILHTCVDILIGTSHQHIIHLMIDLWLPCHPLDSILLDAYCLRRNQRIPVLCVTRSHLSDEKFLCGNVGLGRRPTQAPLWPLHLVMLWIKSTLQIVRDWGGRWPLFKYMLAT